MMNVVREEPGGDWVAWMWVSLWRFRLVGMVEMVANGVL